MKSIFRRKLLVENGIRFLEETIIEDTPFNLDAILSAKAIWFIDKPFYYYVQTPNSLIRSSYKRNFCEKLNNCYKARKEISEKHGLQGYQDTLALYNMRHSMVMLLTNEIHNSASLRECIAELKRIRSCELARETFKNETVFCVKSRFKWILLLFNWRLYLIVAAALKLL